LKSPEPTSPAEGLQSRRAEVWSRYWAQGARHSCGGSFGQQYGGAIGVWWQQVFQALPAGTRVLDLATGSGAVLQLGLAHTRFADIHLEGVDLMHAAPPWLLQLPAAQAARVRIHHGVSTEQLPFPDGSIDLVTSQFGLEYTRLPQTLAEARRVLRAGGSLRAVLHHSLARPLVLARHEIEHIRWLLQPAGLLDLAAQMAEPLSRAATPAGRASLAHDPGANALRQAFNSLQDERIERARTQPCPDVLHELQPVLAQLFRRATEQGAAAGQRVVQSHVLTLQDAAFRLQDLLDHALTPQSLSDVRQLLEHLGFVVRTDELHEGDLPMGWSLEAALPSA
jgi:SAM-dependent methyltransferase